MCGARLADGISAVAGLRDPETRRLGIVFGLPLLDGVFVSLVLAGLLDTMVGVAVTGVLIFGGTATVAVILADGGRAPRTDLSRLALIGAVAVPLAGIQAMLAPNLAVFVNPSILDRFAAVVLALLAVTVARPAAGRRLPSPWFVIACGLVASFQPSGELNASAVSPTLFVHGAGAALFGLVIAAGVVLAGTWLRRRLDPGRLRLGAGASLIVVALSLLTALPTALAIPVLLVSVVFAVDLDGDDRFGSTGPAKLVSGGE